MRHLGMTGYREEKKKKYKESKGERNS